MGFQLSKRDNDRLKGVHPHLVAVIRRAADTSDVKFTVLEGVRTIARQKELVAKGASKTMNSRHIPASNGLSHAVDIAPLDGTQVSWAWPLYHKLAPVVKAAAKTEKVPIEWGGDWRTFKDGPHWQLPWKEYPGSNPAVARAEPITEKTDADLSGSKTLAGAGVATAGVAVGAADVVAEATQSLGSLTTYSKTIATVFIVLSLIGIGLVVYARLDAAKRVPWKKYEEG